jgi:hypothetical protein
VRVLALLCVLLFGCEYDVDNYYAVHGADDGGVAVDARGEDDMPSIFKPSSKLYGHETLIMDNPAMLLCDVETVDKAPHLVTLSMGNAGIVNQAIGVIPAAEMVAVLEMGIGGSLHTAEIDMIRGQQLSLAVSSLRVLMRFTRVNGAAALPTPAPTWEVSASIAQGTIAHGLSPQRTIGTENGLAAGVGITWPIPPFAKAFYVVALPSNAQLNVQVVRMGGNVIATYPTVAYPSGRYPIPSDAWAVTILNAAAPAPPLTSHRVIFELAL